MNLSLSESAVRQHCRDKDVEISVLELLPAGGVRLVCSSSDGAERLRRALAGKLIKGEVVRERIRPVRPLW
ncbi:MAG: hypothetical protein M3Q52_10010 [Pseudomonadota bacterium]|nr:hypothetical protein [Pseudomonadota bacterium]